MRVLNGVIFGRRVATVSAALGLVLTMTTPPATVQAVVFHQFSWATEESAVDGYTGVKNNHYVLNLSNSGGWIYQFMWLIWDIGYGDFIEVGTAYGNNGTANYGYKCDYYDPCGFMYWNDITPGGAHIYKIARTTTDHTLYYLYVDGLVVASTYSSYTNGERLRVGLESYNPTFVFPTYASYYLAYKRWDGSFQDWAGEDGQRFDSAMCGRWALPTSWWAGENTTCD